jgi:hypothetical protein
VDFRIRWSIHDVRLHVEVPSGGEALGLGGDGMLAATSSDALEAGILANRLIEVANLAVGANCAAAGARVEAAAPKAVHRAAVRRLAAIHLGCAELVGRAASRATAAWVSLGLVLAKLEVALVQARVLVERTAIPRAGLLRNICAAVLKAQARVEVSAIAGVAVVVENELANIRQVAALGLVVCIHVTIELRRVVGK